MAQIRSVNLVRNMLALTPPPQQDAEDHDREVLVVRLLWLLCIGVWVGGGIYLVSPLLLAAGACWIAAAVWALRFEEVQ